MSILQHPGTVWLDTARRDPDSGNDSGLLFSDPREIITAGDSRSLKSLLEELDRVAQDGFHAVLILFYEAAYALHSGIFSNSERRMLGWLGVYERPQQIDFQGAKNLLKEIDNFRVQEPEFSVSPANYEDAVSSVRDAIREGDVYQVNYTAPMGFRLEGDPVGLYRALREKQKVAYGTFANLGDRQVLSLSPELFFRVDAMGGDRVITARPMKGTVKRGQSRAEDNALAEALEVDPKNRAENLMIVDLLRNDLARVAKPGSVTVPRLYSIEHYESVIQMTSTVQAMLRKEATFSSLFEALFPCGSVTGAPKLSAMNLIRRLETDPRGVYCGAVGYAGAGKTVFNVPIRTIEISNGKGTLGLGSGIVWDSVPEKEYAECLLKGKFLTDLVT